MTPRELYQKFLEIEPVGNTDWEYNAAQEAILAYVLADEKAADKYSERLESEYVRQHKLTGKDLGV